MRFLDFQALNHKFDLTLNPKVLKIECLTFGITAPIFFLMGYLDESPPKKFIKLTLLVKGSDDLNLILWLKHKKKNLGNPYNKKLSVKN